MFAWMLCRLAQMVFKFMTRPRLAQPVTLHVTSEPHLPLSAWWALNSRVTISQTEDGFLHKPGPRIGQGGFQSQIEWVWISSALVGSRKGGLKAAYLWQSGAISQLFAAPTLEKASRRPMAAQLLGSC